MKSSKRSLMERNSPGLMERKATRKVAEELAKQYESGAQTEGAEQPAALRSFKERNDKERARFKDATDTECYLCVVFRTRADKDAFIAEFGTIDIPLIPGTPGNKYIDGPQFAERIRSLLKPL